MPSTGPSLLAAPDVAQSRILLLIALLLIALPGPAPFHSWAVHAAFAITYGIVVGWITKLPSIASPGAFVVGIGIALATIVIADVLGTRRALRTSGMRGLRAALRLADRTWVAALIVLAAWMGASALRHVELALAACAALVFAARQPRRRLVFGTAAAIVLARLPLQPIWVLALLGGVSAWAAWRRVSWRNVDRSMRWTALGAAAGTVIGFLAGTLHPAERDFVQHLQVRGVYDLAPDATGSRLAFTTKGRLPPGLLDRTTGAVTIGALHDATAFERIAWLPGTEQAAISGVGGITLVDFATHTQLADVARMLTIDVAAVGPRRIAYVEEGSPVLHLFDLDTGRDEIRHVPWGPYALEYVAPRDALFVTAWLGEPKVVRLGIGDGSYHETWNGWGSTDVCALPERGEIAVARPAYADVVILDDATLARRRRFDTDPMIREIECDAARGVIFTSSYFDGRVRALDAETGRTLDQAWVGGFTRALRYDARQRVLFTGSGAGIFELPVVDARGGRVAFRRNPSSPTS